MSSLALKSKSASRLRHPSITAKTAAQRRSPAAKTESLSPLSARARLLTTARRLFYQEGPRAVGIDRVLAESGVAKMTLYRNFASKDDLIVACLEEHEKDYWKLWETTISPQGASPAEQIRNAVAFISRRTSEPTYQGCIFLNTAQSFPDESHPAHRTAVQHKRTLASRLLKLCRAAGATNPLALSQQLVLLINGAQATAGMLGRETQLAIISAADSLLHAQGIRS